MPKPCCGRSLLVAAVLVPLACFVTIAWAALGGSQLPEFDKQVADYWQEAAKEQSILRGLMIGFTHAGGIKGLIALAVVGAAWQWWRGRWQFALAWLGIAAGGALLNLALKVTFDRLRPPNPDPFVTERNESFPSGHSMGGMVGYGMLAYVIYLTPWRRSAKVLLILGLALLVVCIGWSRFFLRAHWFSDVLGGFSIGLAWLMLGLGCLERWRSSQVAT